MNAAEQHAAERPAVAEKGRSAVAAARLPSGLHARPDRTGRIRYRVKFHCGRRVYLFHLGAVSRAEAEAFLREMRDLAVREKLGLGPTLKPPPTLPFADVARRYVKALEALGRRDRAVETAVGHVAIVHPFIGQRPFAVIRPDEIESLRDALLETRGGRTVKNYLDTLHAIFAYGVRKRYAATNPVDGVERPSVEPPAYRDVWDLHPREDERLLAVRRVPWIPCAVALGLYLGLRETPIASLLVEDVDLLNDRNPAVRVLGTTNKGRRGRGRKTEWKPIPWRVLPLVVDQLARARHAGSPWLFPSPANPSRHVSRRMLLRGIQRAAKNAGLGEMTFHDLRHIADRRIKAAGLAELLETAQRGAREALGHDSQAASAMYSRYDADALRPVFDRLEAWIDEQIRGPSRGQEAVRPH